MTELTDEQEREAKEVLNTFDAETLNLVALDRKYEKEWYEEKLDELEEIDTHLEEVGVVMEMAERKDVQRAIANRRQDVEKLTEIMEQAIENLEEQDGTDVVR